MFAVVSYPESGYEKHPEAIELFRVKDGRHPATPVILQPTLHDGDFFQGT